MPVFPVPGSERFETITRRADELVVSPKLRRYASPTGASVDPITFEVVSHKLVQLNEELAATIRKISGSPVVTEAYDFNVGLGDQNGDLFAIGNYINGHATTLQQMIRWTLEHRSDNPGIEPGDMFLVNDPWVGAAHQNDVSLLAPLFVDGELFAWSAATLHQIDVGGIQPGSFCVDADDVFSEGMPMPPIKLIRGGTLQRDVEDAFLRRSRFPALVELDLRAMIAANHVAQQRLRGLVDDYGADVVHTIITGILDGTEQRFKERLRRLPDGEWCHVHPVEVSRGGDRTVHKVVTRMRKEGDRLTFDATESDPQTGYFNVTRHVYQAGIMTAVLPLLCPDLPWASGAILRAIDFEFTPGTIPAASFPAAVSGGLPTSGWVGINSATVLISTMLAGAEDDLKSALAAVTLGAFPLVLLSGIGKDGVPTVMVGLDAVAGGTGARSWRDGDDSGGMLLSPGSQIANVETQEWHYPVLYLWRKELPDTAGAGRFRGGCGGELALITHDTPGPLMQTCSAFGMAAPPSAGLCGGAPARSGAYRIVRASGVRAGFEQGDMADDAGGLDGAVEWCVPKGTVSFGSDDVFVCSWTGGGGYGDPLTRDPERVAADVREGYLTAAGAAASYGVVLDGDAVDDRATRTERERLRGRRLGDAPRPAPASPREPAPGEVRLDENLAVNDRGDVSCLRCEHSFGDATSFQERCAIRELPLVETSLVWVDPATYVDDALVYRELACPGCATLLDTEVALAGWPITRDKVLRVASRPPVPA